MGTIFFYSIRKTTTCISVRIGLGDQLICNCFISSLSQRKSGKIWMMSHYRYSENNRDIDIIVPDSWRVIKYCSKFNVDIIELKYGN